MPTPLRLRAAALAVVSLLALAACSSKSTSPSTSGQPPLKVGILQLSQAKLLDDIVSGFKKGITRELAPRQVVFDVKNAQGDNSLIQSIARQLAESDADMFATAGTPGLIALANIEKRRPIIGLAMTDPVKAKVANSLDASGTNVTGSLGYIPPAFILDQMLQIQPAPKTFGTVYDPSNEASNIWERDFKAALATHPGMKLIEATIAASGDIPLAARSLVGRADTWVLPPDATVIAGLPGVGSIALSAKASLIITGGDATTAGVLASLGPDYGALGELGGVVAARVVRGEKPGTVPFARPSGANWVVNKATVTALGVTLPPSATAGASAAPSTSPAAVATPTAAATPSPSKS
jgi:putative ABC transport system substrate-binding protein